MFLYSKWLSLPLHIRAKIANEFGVVKIRPTHVSDNVVVDDGYNLKDVERIVGLENLQSYFKTEETDLEVLFTMLIDWAEDRKPIERLILTEKEDDTTENKGGDSEGTPKQGGKIKKA